MLGGRSVSAYHCVYHLFILTEHHSPDYTHNL